jgi:NADH-quinone oxidoreductase subunit C
MPDRPPEPPAPRPAPEGEADATGLSAPVPSRPLERLREALPGAVLEVSFHCGVPIVRVDTDRIVEVGRFLKEDPQCAMRHLADLCGVDRIGMGGPDPRFDVVYQLLNIDTGERLTLKAAVAEGGEIPSVASVWRTANWHEREAYDLLGIPFAGHPDLRRILMPETFDAWPLRKDFPLEGRERDHGYWRRPEDDDRADGAAGG